MKLELFIILIFIWMNYIDIELICNYFFYIFKLNLLYCKHIKFHL